MTTSLVFARDLTKSDLLVLRNLEEDIHLDQDGIRQRKSLDHPHQTSSTPRPHDVATLSTLEALNDPASAEFEPTVFNNFDHGSISLPKNLANWLYWPYVRAARKIVRVETDVVMLTHLLLYFCTSVPSALYLFRSFSWLHGIAHVLMQISYVGTYTLMMHQHIHMRGILAKRFALFDAVFPYITDPLMGHTWNSYFYHHVKHHHVEGNGPDDLSSTIRYQRDSLLSFLHYLGRFYFFIWLDLPLYFLRKGRTLLAAKTAFWELGSLLAIYVLYRINAPAATCVFVLPLLLMRTGLMVGNWGQHAFVDAVEPDSDYRSSVTLIDVASNRHCFNDGYHTSHHLNPLRHWREHPAAFVRGKRQYSDQHAIVFHDIDYIMITVRLFLKDYETLARCMVPMGEQMAMTLEERAALLRRCTQRFSEEEIKKKFPAATKSH